jgi:DNA polymerase beta
MAQKSQNTQFIDIMDELSEMMLKNNEVFRARAYKKAQETIMNYPHDIIDPSQLKGLPGIGTTIMDKLIEYFTTGTLKLLEIERNKPQHIFCNIYGVGPKKAQELVENGIYSIEQLKEPNNQKMLNDIQRVGLKYYEDILKRIPRVEIEEYKKYFSHYFKFIEKREKKETDEKDEKDEMFEIVGSYRRNAETSGDIDVILKNCDFKEFIDFFISKNIIIEVLSRGPTKCLVIAKLPNSATYRRVDFLYTSEEEFPFAILYFTGSKYFNTVMRQHALNIGYTMNEHNLCHFIKNDDKKREKGIKGSKVNHSFKTEQDIFNYLNLEYKEPHERIDGRSVVLLSKQNLKEIIYLL